MQNLHGITERHRGLLDRTLTEILRDGARAPIMPLERYQQEVVGRFLQPDLRRVRIPRPTDWIGWDAAVDPLHQRPIEFIEIDTARVVGRLDRYIATFEMENIDLRGVGLAISRDEARALTHVGVMHEGAELRYRGVRLFVDG